MSFHVRNNSDVHRPAVVQQEAEQAEQDEPNSSQYRQQKDSVVHIEVLRKNRICTGKKISSWMSLFRIFTASEEKTSEMFLTWVHRRHGCQPVAQLRSDVRQSQLAALLLYVTPSALYPTTCMKTRDSNLVSVNFIKDLWVTTEETVHYLVQTLISYRRVSRWVSGRTLFPVVCSNS